MAFILRFVQRFKPADRDAFMKLEAEGHLDADVREAYLLTAVGK